MSTTKSCVWSLPTLLFHWILVIGITAAFLLHQGRFLSVHVALGYMVAVLIFFRFIWGWTGPAYSRFSDFPLGFGKLKEFLTNIRMEGVKYSGHNPAASLAMVLIFVVGLLTAVTGIFLLTSEQKGFFAPVNQINPFEVIGKWHNPLAYILAFLVIAHIIGVIIDTVLHPAKATLGSIFNGRKNWVPEEVRLTPLQKGFSIVWIVVALFIFFLSLLGQQVSTINP